MQQVRIHNISNGSEKKSKRDRGGISPTRISRITCSR